MTFKKMLPARSFAGPLERIGPLVPGYPVPCWLPVAKQTIQTIARIREASFKKILYRKIRIHILSHKL